MSLVKSWMSRTLAVVIAIAVVVSGAVQATPAWADSVTAGEPYISGATPVGSTLTANEGEWIPAETTFTYVWRRDGVAIDGATAKTYVTVTADIGATITATVTGSAETFDSASVLTTNSIQPQGVFITTSIPTIGGNVGTNITNVGDTLFVDEGAWDPYPDNGFVFLWKRNGIEIPGVDPISTYTVTADDIGTDITVTITANHPNYPSTSRTSLPFTVRQPFTSSPPPTITGTTSTGSRLTANMSGWIPSTNVTYTYKWQRTIDSVTTEIPGAAGSSYVVRIADVDATISVVVEGSNAGYASLATSAQTEMIVRSSDFVTTTDPTITGTATFGSTLTANVSGWSPAAGVTYTYQWKRTVDENTADISGATASTYILTAADIDATISVAIEGSKAGYTTTTRTSADTATIAAKTFTFTYDPEILGETTFGSTLTAHIPYWAPSSEVTYTYQWRRTVDSTTTDISGATSRTYVVTAADIDTTISVAIEGSKVGYTTVPATSAESDTIILAAFSATGTPLITGGEQIGNTLTAATGTWTPTPDSFAYQWKRDGVDITDATNATYVLTVDDLGTDITVDVTAALFGHMTETTSSATKSISLRPFLASPSPVISGTARVGGELTSTIGAWNPVPDSFEYQWLCDNTVIDGATTTSLSLSASEVGCVITVSVTPTLAGYSTAAGTSLGTVPVVTSDFDAVGSPSITGTFEIDGVLTVDPGSWTPAPDSFTYQWTRDDVAITDATEETYTLTALDMGTDIIVEVTATLEGYSTRTRDTFPTTIPFMDFDTSELPTIDGVPDLDATLTAAGDVFSPTPDSLTYQWYRNGVAIVGGTDDTYTVVSADSESEITVEVTASRLGYSNLALTSNHITASEIVRYSASPPPSITGIPQVGRTLTSNSTNWTPVQDSFDYQWLRNGVAIVGATEATYELVGIDAGAAVSVRIMPVRVNHVSIARESPRTSTVLSGGYTVKPTPTISGVTAVGQLLTAATSGWDPTPTSFTYAWLRNGIVISGATSSTYRLTAADRGSLISVRVIPVLTGYSSTSKTSVATSAITTGTFTSTTVPTISGTVAVGQVLTAATAAWSPTAVITYQWKRGGAAISGATSAQYTVAPADAGSRLSVTATGTADGVTSASTTSSETIVVPALSFTGGTNAVIVGDPSVGATLSVNFGTLSPTPTSITYQWKREGIDIDGATTATYVPTFEDQWLDITVTVTAVRVGYTSWTRTTATPANVGAGIIGSRTVPRITGTTRVGSTLRGSTGTWTNAPDTFDYQWYRDGELIEDAIGINYVLTSEDLGSTFALGVTAHKEGFVDESAYSLSTDEVLLAKFNAQPVPTITGTAKVGSTLTAVAGAWSPTPTTFSYQWTRTGVPITGATSSTYVLTSADAGGVIRVIVAGIRESYSAEPQTSAPSVAVASGTFSATPAPTITGVAKVDEVLTASVPSWTPTVDSSVYQWKRNGVAIDGATSLTYRVAAADLAALLTFTVTGVKAGFVSAVSTSATTSAVVAAVFGTQPVPTITGITSVNETLTARTDIIAVRVHTTVSISRIMPAITVTCCY